MLSHARSSRQLRGVVHRVLAVGAVGDVFFGTWSAVERPCIVVASSMRPRLFSSAPAPPTDTPPSELPSLSSVFDPDESVFVNKLPLVVALLARITPSGAKIDNCLFALCMRRSGKTAVLQLLRSAAEGDRHLLRWLVHPSNPAYPALQRFLQKPGVNGFTLFETTYPVIYLDLSTGIDWTDSARGETEFSHRIVAEGRRLGITLGQVPGSPAAAITAVVEALRAKVVVEMERLIDGKVTRVRVPKRIVLLIDEYDKPITEALSHRRSEEVLEVHVAALSAFFSSAKGMTNYFHLVLRHRRHQGEWCVALLRREQLHGAHREVPRVR
jgi:hypothetical protein